MKQAVIVYKRHNLTKGQTALYELITLCTQKGQPILFSEARSIWFDKVARNVKDGWPHRFNYWHHKNEKDEWVGGYTPYTQDQLRQALLVWTMTNIGALVLKGYLKVIPQIELV